MRDYDLSIIVVAWNVKELLDECFAALRGSDDGLRKQILLVDNGSVDGSADFVAEKYPEVELIRSPTNLGFIRANNLAYKRATGEFILMLNSDAFVSPTAIRETTRFIKENPEVGVVGARLIGRDAVLQPSARYFPTPLRLFLARLGLDGKLPFVGRLDDVGREHTAVRECDWVVGCYLLARKEAIDRTGFFLREDFFMYNDDNDLCKRIKKLGYKVFFYPVDVVHVGGANMKKMHKKIAVGAQVLEYQIESQMIYFRKNHGLGMVIANAAFGILFDVLIVVKRALSMRFNDIREESLPRMRLVMHVLSGTNWGKHPIH